MILGKKKIYFFKARRRSWVWICTQSHTTAAQGTPSQDWKSWEAEKSLMWTNIDGYLRLDDIAFCNCIASVSYSILFFSFLIFKLFNILGFLSPGGPGERRSFFKEVQTPQTQHKKIRYTAEMKEKKHEVKRSEVNPGTREAGKYKTRHEINPNFDTFSDEQYMFCKAFLHFDIE